MNEAPVIRVSEVMKRHVDIVDGQTSVADALSMMKHVETKCLIVDKRHEDDEYGIVLLSDVAQQVLARRRAPERVDVYEIMTKPVLSVPPHMKIHHCAKLFDTFGVDRAPVIGEDGRVLGVVSYTDLVLKGMCRDM
jgi:CBS domain-containing protein